MRVTIVGNNNLGRPSSDGARMKIRTVIRSLKQLGHDVDLIDTSKWKLRFINIFFQFKHALVNADVVVIMCAQNGSKFFLNACAKLKRKCKVVYCPVGMGTINLEIKGLSSTDEQLFLSKKCFFGRKDQLISDELKQVDSIVVESQLLKDLYESFYGVSNVKVLTNYRYVERLCKSDRFLPGPLHIVFFARVIRLKGIFDLMSCVLDINRSASSPEDSIYLDIYGSKSLTKEDNELFEKYLKIDNKIKYKGVVGYDDAIETLSKYDLLCFPSLYHEGVPGSLIESIIALTPCLSSSIAQVQDILLDEVNGFVFKFGDVSDLKYKLKSLVNNREALQRVSKNLITESKKYVFEGNIPSIKDAFLLN